MGVLTGRKVFAIVAGFFGVIIVVNFFMAFKAVGTFPGVVERQPYVASQTFDVERRAQEALGWTVTPEYDAAAGELRLAITDTETGYPSEVRDLSVLVGRATQRDHDSTPSFTRSGGVYAAPAVLDRGYWILMVEAHATDGTRFRQRLRIWVTG
jgi:nitrogen fixation protein FixH